MASNTPIMAKRNTNIIIVVNVPIFPKMNNVSITLLISIGKLKERWKVKGLFLCGSPMPQTIIKSKMRISKKSTPTNFMT